MPHKALGRSLAKVDAPIAREVGVRIRAERLKAGLTQARLAEGRYTKAYISALEKGLAKPWLAALSFIAHRLALPPAHFLRDAEPAWSRLEADLHLASGDWVKAADAYEALLERETQPVRRAGIGRASPRRGVASSDLPMPSGWRVPRPQRSMPPACRWRRLERATGWARRNTRPRTTPKPARSSEGCSTRSGAASRSSRTSRRAC
jgi:transcriptional regulator with XRE-family HTH domain